MAHTYLYVALSPLFHGIGFFMEDLSFVCNEVYLFRDNWDIVFVCLPCANDLIGKLVQYKKSTNSLYEKTNIAYFINHYVDGDIKSVFLNRNNYAMIGSVGTNFTLTNEGQYLIRGGKCENQKEVTNDH